MAAHGELLPRRRRGLPRTDIGLVGDDSYAYSGEDTAGLGLLFYNYLFRVQNVVAKVFVAGDAKLLADTADTIAFNAEDRIVSHSSAHFRRPRKRPCSTSFRPPLP